MATFYCLKYNSAFSPTGPIGEVKTLGGRLFSAQYLELQRTSSR